MTNKETTIQKKAEMAMKSAVKKVVERHRKSGRPLAIWENGKVKKIKV